MPNATSTGLIGHEDIGAYTNPDAKTLIIDVETGERVPHFAELDMSTNDDTQRMLIIHPVSPMRHGARYVAEFKAWWTTPEIPCLPHRHLSP